MARPFALDGYDVLAPLGVSGRSWRARRLADGQHVALRRWVAAAPRLADVRRRAALWGAVREAGVVPVHDVVCQGDDLVVVTGVAAAGGLDALLARQGSLSNGQVVTLVAGVAASLATAHRRGFAHGRVSAGNVVLDGAGRPLLTDYVLSEGDPIRDVEDLVTLACDSVPSDRSGELRDVLGPVTDAEALMKRALAWAPAEPLRACAEDVAPDDTTARTGPSVRTVALVVAAAVAAAVLVGVGWGSSVPARSAALPPPPRTSAPVVPAPDWPRIVRALERRRMRALATADSALLSMTEVRGRLRRHDSRAVARLIARGLRLRGLRAHVHDERVLAASDTRAVLRVVDSLSSYEVVDRDGRVVARHAARRQRAVTLVLVGKNGRWMLHGVR